MQNYFILIGNSSRALVYATNKKHPHDSLQYITELTHPESRKKGIELITDRPGSYQTDHSTRGAFVNHVGPKEKEADQFAKIINDYLEEENKKRAFHDLIVISPPHFFGLLEKHFSKHLFNCIKKVIQKDYTSSTEPELRKILQEI